MRRNIFSYDEAIFSVEEDSRDRSIEVYGKLPKSRVIIHRREKCSDVRAVNYNYALREAKGDWLYVLAPDLALDEEMFVMPWILDYWPSSPPVDVVTFRYWNGGLDLSPAERFREEWDNTLKHLLDLTPRKGDQRSGLMAIRRSAWEKTGGFRDCPNFEEVFLLKSGLHIVHDRKTRIMHLRSGYSPDKQYLQGVARRRAGYPAWKTLAHSMLHLKPHVLRGYLQGGEDR
jgi:hypothetical protein